MPDREKVIKEAEEELEYLAPDDKHRLHMGIMMKLGWIYDVLTLLKEQETVKPIVHSETKYHHEYKECGACGAFLTRGARFCSKCGRPVKRDA
jgi:hypothetical protein